MENERAFIDDMIERYVYQASRHMPRPGREDAVKELRALIADMLNERANGLPPTKKQLEAVFVELGSPEEFGAKYKNTEGRVLIGKAYYPIYIKIVKIVAAAVPFGLGVATLIQVLLGELPYYLGIAQWFAQSITALLTAFGAITLVFAIMEYKGVKAENFSTSSGPFDLPPVPKEPERPKGIAGVIAAIVFTVLFSLLFALVPNIFSIYTADGGFVPMFNAQRVQEFLPIVFILMAIGIGKELYRYLDKRRGAVPFVVTTLFGAANLVFALLLFGDATIWNASFLVDAAAGYGSTDALFGFVWRNITHYFPLLFVFAFVLETATNAAAAFGHKTAQI